MAIHYILSTKILLNGERSSSIVTNIRESTRMTTPPAPIPCRNALSLLSPRELKWEEEERGYKQDRSGSILTFRWQDAVRERPWRLHQKSSMADKSCYTGKGYKSSTHKRKNPQWYLYIQVRNILRNQGTNTIHNNLKKNKVYRTNSNKGIERPVQWIH